MLAKTVFFLAASVNRFDPFRFYFNGIFFYSMI
jgi:hypothetical protein